MSDIVRFDSLEDRITAQLIATLENSPKDKVLNKFLELFGFEYKSEEVDFSLQVQELHSRPDAMIQSESFLIYVETKLGDAINPAQIESHFEGGKGKRPTFIVLCITAGLDKPEGIQEAITRLRAKGDSPDIRWVSWKKIYALIKDLADTLKDDKTIFLLNNLAETLEWKNLSGFTPFKKKEFLTAKEAIPTFTETLGKFDQLMDEVASILKNHLIKKVFFYRDGKANSKLDLITQAKYGFNKKDWEPENQPFEGGSEVIVQVLFKEAVLFIGFQVNRDVVYKQDAEWKALIQEMKSPEYSYYNIHLRTRGRATDVEPEGFLRQLEETREDKAIDHVFYYIYYDLCDAKTVDLLDPDNVASLIERQLDILERYKLYSLIKPE